MLKKENSSFLFLTIFFEKNVEMKIEGEQKKKRKYE